MTEYSHQFKHSDYQRRESVVYGSQGKGGLFIPSDFIRPRAGSPEVEDVFDDNGEELPLLGSRKSSRSTMGPGLGPCGPGLGPSAPGMGPHSTESRRLLAVDRDVLAKERQVLRDSHLSFPLDSPEDIRMRFEHAVTHREIAVTSVAVELKALMMSSIPLVTTFLLQNSLSTVSVLSVGHLGATELAAVSMGSMTANITGYATIQGIATALDTLCPQAFGAKRYHLIGAYFQKCAALISAVMVPVLIVWVFFGYQLICLLVPDKETAKLSAKYLQIIAPGIPGYVLFECGKRFLQAQGVYHISTYVLMVAAPSNAAMTVVLVRAMGYIGAPIAVAINYWIMAFGLWFLTVFYVRADQTSSGMHPLTCWDGWSFRLAFSAWGSLIHLAIPGLIMLEAEFLAFEILTLMASYLGTVALAAQSIGSTMASLTYQIPFAIGIAASTRIANYLGAGLSRSAERATNVALAFGAAVSMVNFSVLYFFAEAIGRLFTGDEEVISLVELIMWLIACMQVTDAINANSAGCLRGQGQTKIGGIVNLVLYYVIGLPLALYLSFYSPWKGSLYGLWVGCVVALALIGAIQSYYALTADFDLLCRQASDRNRSDA